MKMCKMKYGALVITLILGCFVNIISSSPTTTHTPESTPLVTPPTPLSRPASVSSSTPTTVSTSTSNSTSESPSAATSPSSSTSNPVSISEFTSPSISTSKPMSISASTSASKSPSTSTPTSSTISASPSSSTPSTFASTSTSAPKSSVSSSASSSTSSSTSTSTSSSSSSAAASSSKPSTQSASSASQPSASSASQPSASSAAETSSSSPSSSTSPQPLPSTPQPLTPTTSQTSMPTASQPLTLTTSEPSTPMMPLSSLDVEDFYNLTKEFWEWKIHNFPQFTTSVGINDDTAGHLDQLSPEAAELRKLKCQDFLQRAQQFNSSGFGEKDSINYKIFLEELNTYLGNFKYLKYFTPISFLIGPHSNLKRTVTKDTVLKSYNDYKKLLSRYSEFPRQSQEMINIMRRHIRDNIMPSNWTLVGVTEQFDKLIVPLNESVFYQPFLNISLNITTEQKEALKEEARQRVQQDLFSSFEKLRDFIELEYVPAARLEEGVSTIPGGLEFYKACLRFHTTTDLTPLQIHTLGLKEVARINAEVVQTAIELGLEGKTIGEISQILKTDPKQQFDTKEDLLNTYRNAVYHDIYPLMEQVVDHVPDVNVTVKENIAGASYASYSDPPLDGSRPGTFYLNAKIYKSHKRYEVNALSLHEAVPGHHLQSVNLIMNPSVPEFRKFPDFYRYGDIPAKFPMNTVYSEGWGLYCEYLGNELGLYKDPYQRLGRHSFELLRACRLVVDTGLHALGWTRQEAINYLLENTAMAEEAIKIQIDRYLSWPGQACAYKVGEIKIRELRSKAEAALGKDLFRVQEFHEAVLGCAGPLNILSQCIESYIAKAKR